jgi:hypothetical protein
MKILLKENKVYLYFIHIKIVINMGVQILLTMDQVHLIS